MILAVSRHLPQLLELQKERTWQPLEGRELRELTIGIVGYGSLGRSVACLATAFGCRVIAMRRHPDARDDESASDDGEGFPFAPLSHAGDARREPRTAKLGPVAAVAVLGFVHPRAAGDALLCHYRPVAGGTGRPVERSGGSASPLSRRPALTARSSTRGPPATC